MDTKYILHGPEPIVPVSEEPLGVQMFGNLLNHKHLPNALIDAITREKVSYSTLLEETSLLANSLQNYGIKQNDVIGICSENNLQYFYPLIAAIYLGAVVTTFNPLYTVRELIHTTSCSKPKILFCSELTLPTVTKAKVTKKVIILDKKQNKDNVDCLEKFIAENSSKNFNINNFKPNVFSTEQIAFILYSSGTTGLPKGVMLTHKNLNVRNAISSDPRFARVTKPGSENVLGLLPFYHGFGLYVGFISLMRGNSIIVLKSFNEDTFLKTIQDYKITAIGLVPSLATILIKSSLVDQYNLSSLVEAGCGAAPLSTETKEAVIKKLNLKLFRESYGLTETSLGVIGTPLDYTREGSCGKVYPYTSAKVVDIETGKLLGPFNRGELCFKSDGVMKGYAGDEEATINAFDQDGWFRTGDIGYYDEDGFFYIVDRLKELIKYKGFQIAPAELEAILVTHPKIADAGVVGFPDEIAGQLPLAFVVKQDSQYLTEDEVQKFVAEQVSPQKHLRGGVRFISQILRNPSGKILRNKLRELIQKQKSKL